MSKDAFPKHSDVALLTNNDAAQTAGIFKILRRWQYGGEDYTYNDALEALNTLIGGHGIESVDPEGAPHFTTEGIRLCPPYSYVNMGDSYARTIAFDHANRCWVVSSFADMLEITEQSYKLGDYAEYEYRPDYCSSCHASGAKITLEEENGRFWWVCGSCEHPHRTPEGFTK